MIESDYDWEDYYFYQETSYRLSGSTDEPEVPKLKVGNTVKITTGFTGCGIIISVWEVPEKYKSLYYDTVDYNYMVTLLTDFGNTVHLSDKQILEEYKVTGIETDIKGRINSQINRLRDVYDSLCL